MEIATFKSSLKLPSISNFKAVVRQVTLINLEFEWSKFIDLIFNSTYSYICEASLRFFIFQLSRNIIKFKICQIDPNHHPTDPATYHLPIFLFFKIQKCAISVNTIYFAKILWILNIWNASRNSTKKNLVDFIPKLFVSYEQN